MHLYLRMLAKKVMNLKSLFMKIVFYYFKVCGVACINLRVKSQNEFSRQQWLFTKSKIGIFYNIFLFLIMSALTIFNISRYYKIEKHCERIRFEKMCDMIQDIFIGSASAFVSVFYVVENQKITQIVKKLNEIQYLTIDIQSNEKSKSIIHVAIIFFISTFLWLLVVLTSPSDKFILYLTYVYPSNCIIYALIIQYTLFVIYINLKLSFINKGLSNFLKDCSLSLSHILLRNESCVIIQFKNRLSKLRKLSENVTELSEILSDFYGRPMLIYILNFFLVLVLDALYVIKYIAFGKNSFKVALYTHHCFYGLLQLYPLFILTKNITACVKEVCNG